MRIFQLPALGSIPQFGGASLFCAIGAAIEAPFLLNSMTNDPATAMSAGRSHCCYRIRSSQIFGLPVLSDLKRLVIFVSGIPSI
jgi:hypothetical protein